MANRISVFDVLDALPASWGDAKQKAWAAVGAEDALRLRVFDPEQYTSARAKSAYKRGYRLAVKLASED
jgi:hypothetical protein